ncbi:MAG TPA: peptidase G2 autoproteolytic cleavage domain-containing protein, partial [Tissierellaceae bacterium]|nr:peptidase G2 autoproteolytic cleavage domain-containing protein [Tissierellaceae bacterium]
RCIAQEWEVVEDEIKYTNLELGNFKQNYFDKQSDVTNRVSKILNNNGTVNALSIEGTLNALQTKFKAMKDIAQTQHVRAMLFEDLDVNSPTFGAMCLGTMGFEIASKRNAENTDWDFRTFGTGKGFDASEINVGILSAVMIQNLDGSFKIDLSRTGGASYYTRGKKAMEMISNRIDFFNHGKDGDFIGSLGSINTVSEEFPAGTGGDPNQPSIGIWNDLDSAISIGYSTTGPTNQRYILFDKYNIMGNNGRPIRINEGVDFLDDAYHYGTLIMNGYPIRLNASGTSHMYSTLIGGTDPAVRIGNSLWVDNRIYANGIRLDGADYSEYFEWLDGNVEDEDRVGYIVALSGDKIIKANGDDILGIISATPSVIGDTSHDGWHEKYLTDKWGRNIYETIEATYDEDGHIITPAHIGREKILNPHYDEELEYIPRSNRREWGMVGLLGKLICRDDGTSSVGDYVTSIDGIASKSNIKTRIRVMKRIDASTIKVFVM